MVGRQERRDLELGLVLRVYGDLVQVGPRARGGPKAGPSGGESDALPLLLGETPLVLLLGANLPVMYRSMQRIKSGTAAMIRSLISRFM